MASLSAPRHIRTALIVRPPLVDGESRFQKRLETVSIVRDDTAEEFVLTLQDESSLPFKQSSSTTGTRDTRSKIDARPEKARFRSAYGYRAEDLSALCPREVEPLVRGVWNGESAAVIAYGQTGSGKSYVCGTEAKDSLPCEWSVGSYVAKRLWELAREGEDVSMSCGMIEIYREGSGKELISDLLGGFDRRRINNYSEHSYKWHEVDSPELMLEKLRDGSRLRATDATDGNTRSSRSHAIFTVRVRRTLRDAQGHKNRVFGRFLLVDLAGAEAAVAAEAGSQKQRQGSGINVGLSTLQLVIKEVSEKGKTLHVSQPQT